MTDGGRQWRATGVALSRLASSRTGGVAGAWASAGAGSACRSAAAAPVPRSERRESPTRRYCALDDAPVNKRASRSSPDWNADRGAPGQRGRDVPRAGTEPPAGHQRGHRPAERMPGQRDRARRLRLDEGGHVGGVRAEPVGALPDRAPVATQVRGQPSAAPGALDEWEQGLPDVRVGAHAVQEDEQALAAPAARHPDPPIREPSAVHHLDAAGHDPGRQRLDVGADVARAREPDALAVLQDVLQRPAQPADAVRAGRSRRGAARSGTPAAGAPTARASRRTGRRSCRRTRPTV